MNQLLSFGKILVFTSLASIILLIVYIFAPYPMVRGACVGLLLTAQLIPLSYNSVAATQFINDRGRVLKNKMGEKWDNSHIIGDAKSKVSNKINEIKDNRAAAAAQKEKEAEKRARIEARKAEALKKIEDEIAAEEAAAQ
jgi:hypothetical protein